MLDYAESIKSMVDMERVCEMYGIPVNQAHKARCPFHNDSHNSLHVYPGQRGWFCYTCNDGGSVIDFVMRYFNLPFKEAMARINDEFNLGLPINQKLTAKERRQADELARKRRAELDAAKRERERLVRAYQRALDVWISLDIARRKYGPLRPGEPISDEYAYAVKNIDEAGYRLELAQVALHEFDQRQKEKQEQFYVDRQKQKSGEMIAKNKTDGDGRCA